MEGYVGDLNEDEQVGFKGRAKAFVRLYAFLGSILPYNKGDWEELSIFLGFLIPKLPSPVEDDLSRGILETIDMDSYRAEKQAIQKILLEDEDAEIAPVPGEGGGGMGEVELDLLSNIVAEFNNRWGNIPWEDADRVKKLVTQDLPAMVEKNAAFRNARKNSDRENARIEHDKALRKAMMDIMTDDTDLFKRFSDNPDFRRWLTAAVFELTYPNRSAA